MTLTALAPNFDTFQPSEYELWFQVNLFVVLASFQPIWLLVIPGNLSCDSYKAMWVTDSFSCTWIISERVIGSDGWGTKMEKLNVFCLTQSEGHGHESCSSSTRPWTGTQIKQRNAEPDVAKRYAIIWYSRKEVSAFLAQFLPSAQWRIYFAPP